MKPIIFLIFVFCPMLGIAQISTHISFDKKEKLVTFELINETDKAYWLAPTYMTDFIHKEQLHL